MASSQARTDLFRPNNLSGDLKELAHADLVKKRFWTRIFVLGEIFLSIHFCFGPFEKRQFKANCSGLNIDWRSPNGVQLFAECVLRHYKVYKSEPSRSLRSFKCTYQISCIYL